MPSIASNPLAEVEAVDIWTTPFLRPPPGVTPNFINPASRGPMVRAVMFSILPIMVLFVGFRIYTRLRLTQSVGVDDYLCLLSAATVIAFSGLMVSYMDNPEGRHGWDIPLGEVVNNHYWIEATFAALLIYTLSNMFTKLTLLTLYHRIFKRAVWSLRAIWLGIITVVLSSLAAFAGYIGLCVRFGQPIWETMREVQCSNQVLSIYKFHGWYGLISDVYILAIPLWLVWDLNLPPRRKAAVLGVFSTGLA
ncbi:GPCR, PTH11-type [Metarhizium robertsii ARSEF 23]|nr:GPCR, PTH11-type [Metarhizium robertsii ARSEF 23]EFY96983.2 GPCR, PTH11-type [Metarhizium robertsii ARSEF 23]